MYFDRRRSIEGALRWGGLITEPRFVVDVGANIGQTLDAFLGWWPSARCLSLEPLPEAFAQLQVAAKQFGERAVVLNCGVGSKHGSMKLYASKTQSTTSSFLKFNKSAETVKAHRGLRNIPSHLELADDDSYEVSVQVDSLDDLLIGRTSSNAGAWFAQDGLDVLKIDTQGWELEVLSGSSAVLSQTRVVVTEWQFDDVYGKPSPLSILDQLLTQAGFRLWDVSHIYKDLDTMRTLWVDLVYAKPLIQADSAMR